MVAVATDTHAPLFLQRHVEFQESSYTFDTNPALLMTSAKQQLPTCTKPGNFWHRYIVPLLINLL
jgi:hypothetical protein